MPMIKFTSALKRFFPNLQAVEVKGNTVAEVVLALEARYPGLRSYLLDEQGCLREHVNIFVDGDLIQDTRRLGDELAGVREVYIMQALSGG